MAAPARRRLAVHLRRTAARGGRYRGDTAKSEIPRYYKWETNRSFRISRISATSWASAAPSVCLSLPAPADAWLARHKLDGPGATAAAAALPQAAVAGFSSRTEHDAFTDMEIAATPGETAAVAARAAAAA